MMPVIFAVANAQIPLHFGAAVGVPLTDTLSSTSFVSYSSSNSSFDQYNSKTKRLLIGPVVRLDLQRGLGLEFDALYQRVNYDHAISNSFPSPPFFSQSFEQTTANRWQFPLLVQYRWTISKIKLFAEVGPSISRIANSRSTISSITVNGSSTSSNTTAIASAGGTWAGVTAGAGIDLPFFHGHLRPEFRYSHWFLPSTSSAGWVTAGFFSLSSPIASPSFRMNQDEASFLLGLTF